MDRFGQLITHRGCLCSYFANRCSVRQHSVSLALATLLVLLPLTELCHRFRPAATSNILVPVHERKFCQLRSFEAAASALRIRGGMQDGRRGPGGGGSSSSTSKGELSDTESSSSDYEDGGGGGEGGGAEIAAAAPERKFAWEAVFGASKGSLLSC